MELDGPSVALSSSTLESTYVGYVWRASGVRLLGVTRSFHESTYLAFSERVPICI